jgi:hypothetical protein
VLLTALSRSLPRSARSSLFVSPATLLRWHRQLAARRWTYSRRTVGRPRTKSGVSELLLRLARENPTWAIGASTVSWSAWGSGLRRARSGRSCADTGSSRRRGGRSLSWSQFLRGASVGDHRLRFPDRRHRLAAPLVRAVLHRTWQPPRPFRRRDSKSKRAVGTQQACNLAMALAEQERPARFLVRDRDSKFSFGFDEVFRSEGVRVNSYAGADAAGEGACGALGGKPAAGMPRPHPDHRSAPPRVGGARLRRPSQRAPSASLARPAAAARETATGRAAAPDQHRAPRPPRRVASRVPRYRCLNQRQLLLPSTRRFAQLAKLSATWYSRARVKLRNHAPHNHAPTQEARSCAARADARAQANGVGCVNSIRHHKTPDLQARPSLRTPQGGVPTSDLRPKGLTCRRNPIFGTHRPGALPGRGPRRGRRRAPSGRCPRSAARTRSATRPRWCA